VARRALPEGEHGAGVVAAYWSATMSAGMMSHRSPLMRKKSVPANPNLVRRGIIRINENHSQEV